MYFLFLTLLIVGDYMTWSFLCYFTIIYWLKDLKTKKNKYCEVQGRKTVFVTIFAYRNTVRHNQIKELTPRLSINFWKSIPIRGTVYEAEYKNFTTTINPSMRELLKINTKTRLLLVHYFIQYLTLYTLTAASMVNFTAPFCKCVIIWLLYI